MINKKAWDSLPAHLQTVIKTAAEATMSWMFSFLEYESYFATKKFIDKGIKITRLDDASMEKLQKMVNRLMLKYSQQNPLYAKVAYSQLKFLQDSAKWRETSSPFSYGRNPKLPDLQAIKDCIK